MNKTLLALLIAAASGAVNAQTTAINTSAAGAAAQVEETMVFGRGETRQVHVLGAAELAEYPAGTSPLKAVEKLPGVNFQSADPYGAYEWSTRIVVRGFGQNQLGFTLDDVPLGDMSYGNHNGLHISRAIISENIGAVALSQGAGSLAAASTSNLGGTLEFTSLDPATEFAAHVDGSVGSDSAQRAFVRVDSGEFGGAGTRLFLSYVDQTTDKWKGDGEQQQEALNFKIVQSIGEAKLTGFYSYSDRVENDYQDMSLEMIDRLGRDWDNYGADYARAVAAAQGNFTGKVNSLDDAYWDAAGLREDNVGYIALDLPLGSVTDWKTTIYQHTNEGQGLWGTPYVPTPNGAPLSIRTTEYDIDRTGVVSGLTFDLGDHSVNAGLWIETNDFNQARRFYGETGLVKPTRSFTEFQRNPLLTQWEYEFTTDTLQLHIQDSWQATDALRIELGVKSMEVEVDAGTVVGDNKTGSIETSENFLPQLGFVYDLTDKQEIYSTLGKNARALIGSATGTSPFSATQAGFEEIRDSIQPETATSLELGWRFRGDSFEGVMTAYYVEFDDRLLAIQQGSAIIGSFNALANVGAVEAIGLEAGLNWQINDNWYWYNSASLNDSTYSDDYFTEGNTRVALSGKTVVDSPELMFNSELGLEMGGAFAKLHFKHTGERYYTYTNDGSVDAYNLLNLSLGYRFEDLGALKQLTAQLDITNLTDEDYISTVGSGGFSNTDPNGTAQTLLPGAPQQAFFSLKAMF
ncbi:TonB-dependent receptor [Cellvibrio fibrivorans]|uniref:Iron complex outermembrane receptor protein n=1 Tax=Cellvibrio fibrivorans TaxID=126350 RepID=A0ABU1UT54_9GAMM|nr:TonB-dependent receptor [Cellvibrio fibrivorans]MDR7088325.1 iron complex outermembrane receptor protein [Cellvibrio fibrivorans]